MVLTERYPHERGRDYAKRVIRDKIISLELEPGAVESVPDAGPGSPAGFGKG